MANAKDFVANIIQIDGVAECLLIRNDGVLLAREGEALKNYSSLIIESGEAISGIMQTSGFGNCRYIKFIRENNRHFYIFPIGRYLLGVKQKSECNIPDMIKTVFSLIERVSTSVSNINQDGS